MYSLYQSQLRKDIQKEVYHNPTCTVDLFGKQYFGTIKVKKIGPWKLQRYQIMGVELPSDTKYVRSEIAKIKKQFRKKCFFFQWGITNEIVSFENSLQKSEEFREDMKAVRIGLTTILHNDYGFKSAFRENMPQAGIVYDVTKSDEELLKDMNESCRKRIKKSIARGMEYAIIEEKDYETFFAKRQKTADAKGFNTISKRQYEWLLQYISPGKWMVIGAFIDGELIAWTICLFTNTLIYCPYGFFDRTYSNIGVQHFLKFKLFSRARDNWFTQIDTGGGAPTGFPNHPLASVSAFKESLGGTKIEQYGSYDIVMNKIVYRAFKMYYKLRG
jgi:lipid II:glycine glycyltransferase (peptidoglycan interpeptide bridge formation enzyme)